MRDSGTVQTPWQLSTWCGRGAVHASLLALYGLGGWLVAKGLMPIRVLLSAIGFTFSLVFATQGCVQTFSEARRVLVCVRRCAARTA